MSWCGWFCDGVTEAAEAVADAAEDVVESVEEGVESAVEAATGAIEDAGEWIADTATDAWEDAEDAVDSAIDWVADTGADVWNGIREGAEDAWEWTEEAAGDAWDWVEETAGDAWDWTKSAAEGAWNTLSDAASAVAEFIEENLPRVIWVVTHLDDAVVALGKGLACFLTGQDETEYDVIEGLFRLDSRMLEARRVAFLPENRNYVVFSDHHMFVAGDALDRFRQIGNHELYVAVLREYYARGHTVIEAGDVEDLWMREVSLSTSLTEFLFDAAGFPVGDALEAEYERGRIPAQAFKIFANNADVYAELRKFHAEGRYLRTYGNHDDLWRSPEYAPGLQAMYAGIQPCDYAFIGPYTDGTPPEQSPRVIVTHGHQIDGWNNSVCREAGEAFTSLASGIPSLAASYTKRSDWEAKLSGLGFDNELENDLLGIDEIELYENIEKDFAGYPYVPQIVLGHTHRPLEDPEIPGWPSRHEWNFTEYTNTGTAGRWEQFIWCATIERGTVNLWGWTRSDSGLRATMFRGGFADYLRPVA